MHFNAIVFGCGWGNETSTTHHPPAAGLNRNGTVLTPASLTPASRAAGLNRNGTVLTPLLHVQLRHHPALFMAEEVAVQRPFARVVRG